MRQVPPSFTAEELLAHGDFLRALARRLLLDASRADDVVQQAFGALS